MLFDFLRHLSEVLAYDPAWMGFNVFIRPEPVFTWKDIFNVRD